MAIDELSSLAALDESVHTAHDLKRNTSIDLLSPPGVMELIGPVLKLSELNGLSVASLVHYSVKEYLLNVNIFAAGATSSSTSPPSWLIEELGGSKRPSTSVHQLHSWANRSIQCYLLTIRDERVCQTVHSLTKHSGGIRWRRLRRTTSSDSNSDDLDGSDEKIGVGRLSSKTIRKSTYCEDETILEVLLDLVTETPKDTHAPETHLSSLLEAGPSRLTASNPQRWQDTYEAKEYQFTIPPQLVRTTQDDTRSHKPLAASNLAKELPALRYCIETGRPIQHPVPLILCSFSSSHGRRGLD